MLRLVLSEKAAEFRPQLDGDQVPIADWTRSRFLSRPHEAREADDQGARSAPDARPDPAVGHRRRSGLRRWRPGFTGVRCTKRTETPLPSRTPRGSAKRRRSGTGRDSQGPFRAPQQISEPKRRLQQLHPTRPAAASTALKGEPIDTTTARHPFFAPFQRSALPAVHQLTTTATSTAPTGPATTTNPSTVSRPSVWVEDQGRRHRSPGQRAPGTRPRYRRMLTKYGTQQTKRRDQRTPRPVLRAFGFGGSSPGSLQPPPLPQVRLPRVDVLGVGQDVDQVRHAGGEGSVEGGADGARRRSPPRRHRPAQRTTSS